MSTRFRIIATSLVIPIVFVGLSLLRVDLEEYMEYKELIVPAVLSLVEMVMVAWVVNFKLKGERLFTVLVFPALSLAIFVAFLDVVISTSGTELDRLSTTLASAILLFFVTYILTASINILNLTAIKQIPLAQAARAAHYVLTMTFSYFSFVLMVSFDIPVVLKVFMTFLLIFTYTFVALWTISLSYSQRIISSVALGFLLSFVFFVLSLWPLESFYFALFITLVYYMGLGVALEIREIVSKWLWYEYLAIFLVIMFILLATASWGVNGTIL